MSADRRTDPLGERMPAPGMANRAAPPPETEQTWSADFAALVERHGDRGEVELIVIAHPDVGAVGSRFRLPRQSRVTVGRAETADLKFTGSPSLSRRHATFCLAEGEVTVEDAGSRNGTFVNGRRITEAVVLESGDRIQIGGVHCKFLRELDVEKAYHDALLELAVRDGLTGAFNRRYFDEELEREIARSRRHGHSFALILADIDHFKGVNDAHGHVVGDQVLREVVMTARECLRSEQALARVGGEELAVLCPETAAAEAGVLAERLRAVLAGHALECLGAEESVTLSFGVAELRDGDSSGAELYARADEALYRSKRDGRNRVTVAPRE